MKRILLASAIALFAGLNAQTTFGVKAGYALSTLNLNENDVQFNGVGASMKSKSGFYVGALVEHKFNNKFAIQGEVEYANLGGTAEVSLPYGTKVTENISINKIVIPVSAKYYVTPELGVYAGPYMAIRTNTSVKMTVSGLPAGTTADPNAIKEGENIVAKEFSSLMKQTDFGLFLGADYNVYKGLFVEARYSFGLTNMVKTKVDNENVKMNFLQIGVGYKFK
ncbi:porin family protein [Chryseobacterium tructae]|uniref:Porin family protein n=1 Tax=Chryseobacterium tructae TaxID=1037380 RepID=A0ABV7XZE0_9FLAO|nr:porin family protein [Chryseobacterium tructae]MDN3692936.1 porin family protein [Chryseobacterium tructae]